MFKKFVKFEVGLLVGTIIGAVVASVVSVVAFGALGFDNSNLLIMQDCLQEELNERRKK